MTHPKNQTNSRQAAPNQIRARPENPTKEGHDQPMQKHLSAKPPANRKSNTHLGITIRWGAAAPCYLPVAFGGAAAGRRPGAGVRSAGATGVARASRGGDALC